MPGGQNNLLRVFRKSRTKRVAYKRSPVSSRHRCISSQPSQDEGSRETNRRADKRTESLPTVNKQPCIYVYARASSAGINSRRRFSNRRGKERQTFWSVLFPVEKFAPTPSSPYVYRAVFPVHRHLYSSFLFAFFCLLLLFPSSLVR